LRRHQRRRRTFLERDGIGIADVACRWARGPGRGEPAHGHALVFVRRGCFVRATDGVAATLDATLAYCVNPDEEERYDHPHDGGDDCTALYLNPELVASLAGGEPLLPRRPLAALPELDLEHPLLLAAARREGDPHSSSSVRSRLRPAPSNRITPVALRQDAPRRRTRAARSSPAYARRSPPTWTAPYLSWRGSSPSHRTI
jgi:hypothetical protein